MKDNKEEIKVMVENFAKGMRNVFGDVFGEEMVQREVERMTRPIHTTVTEILEVSAGIMDEWEPEIAMHVVDLCIALLDKEPVTEAPEEPELLPYQKRMQREYWSLKRKRDRLNKKLNDKSFKFTSPTTLMYQQLFTMDQYLSILEKRAEIEGVPLGVCDGEEIS